MVSAFSPFPRNPTSSWPLTLLPNNKILDMPELKTFAGNKINATQKLKFALGGVENIVGKGKNAGFHNFLLFPRCLQQRSLPGLLNFRIVW